jgi:DNA-binding transcriptional ArsR family regulator
MPVKSTTPDIAAVAALVGDPTRARMLTALMDGRAQTATELALAGEVMPSTASSHLGRLEEAGLIDVVRQGRHRYVRLASAEIAELLERLMHLAPPAARHAAQAGPRDEGLRRARVCYDHLAGEAGVSLLAKLREKKLLRGKDESLDLTREGAAWCARIGLDLEGLRAKRRPLCLPCLDWSERRTHLAGALGAAILDRLFALRLARRIEDSRVVHLLPRGERFLESLEIAKG